MDADHAITPAIHSRIDPGLTVPQREVRVVQATRLLINDAREARLDVHEGVRLPDIALLALLQHHGAATPLLDVSLDPLVGLYMAVEGPDGVKTDEDGVLLALKRPLMEVPSFTTASFEDVYGQLMKSKKVAFYTSPPVSNRLLIQRGAFLLSSVSNHAMTSMNLNMDTHGGSASWLSTFLEHVGTQGSVRTSGDVGAYRVAGPIKTTLKVWLENRTGLTTETVLPPAWHSPHLDAFCSSHSRSVPFT